MNKYTLKRAHQIHKTLTMKSKIRINAHTTENNSYAKTKVVHFISYGESGYNLFACGKKKEDERNETKGKTR